LDERLLDGPLDVGSDDSMPPMAIDDLELAEVGAR
jgi:hypothetical protein